jgi:hypothetical protein
MNDVPIEDIIKAGRNIFWCCFLQHLNICTCFIWNYIVFPLLYSHTLNN